MERVDAAPDGDVVLVVASTLELRVSSVILSLTSPVFKAMLGPNFAEGHALRNNTTTVPKMIPLPEDDAEAMKILCLILHLQNTKVRTNIDLNLLLRFAIAVDKYGYTSAVKYAASTFLRATKEEFLALVAPEVLLQAAYLLDDAEHFALFTNTYNRRRGVDETQLANPLTTKLPDKIYRALSVSQAQSIKSLSADIDDTAGDVGQYLSDVFAHLENGNMSRWRWAIDEKGCQGLRGLAHFYLEELANAKLWPRGIRGADLCDLLADIDSFDIPNEGHLAQFDLCGTCILSCVDDHFNKGLGDLKKKAEVMFAGVCLDCSKAGGTYNGMCRFEHDD
ncbi:hypothetical protein LTR36_008261 [Oleoguttula mirabilis]|uniref:BTB domain-containing protein n=1 Tax=Oleoguttula mirabilis TaxID=1507867 RepID=A0AAV9J7Z3_9PEZI|nr:hypothetical protein LTR36_008261 [Oleoguttula mirabilis]